MIFDNRHFDTKRKSWFIGENEEGRNKIETTINEFYEQLTKLIEVSEDIRELNK